MNNLTINPKSVSSLIEIHNVKEIKVAKILNTFQIYQNKIYFFDNKKNAHGNFLIEYFYELPKDIKYFLIENCSDFELYIDYEFSYYNK